MHQSIFEVFQGLSSREILRRALQVIQDYLASANENYSIGRDGRPDLGLPGDDGPTEFLLSLVNSDTISIWAPSENCAKVVFMALLFHFGASEACLLDGGTLLGVADAQGRPISSVFDYVVFAFDTAGFYVRQEAPTGELEQIEKLLQLVCRRSGGNWRRITASDLLGLL